ncbi:hypothetical protein O9992_09790 [Vibrio lentus]|nr:hypothetical protein [Vibrio lentus]
MEASFNAWLRNSKPQTCLPLIPRLTALITWWQNLVGLSATTEEGVAAAYCARHLDAPQQLDRDWVLEQLKPIPEDDAQAKVGQNPQIRYRCAL